MSRNDFFKYILLNGGSQADKKEIESETIPFTFKSNGGRLRNYRIYGAVGGVGDEIMNETDDNYGKYVIPVTVRGKNLFSFSAWASTLTSVYRGTFVLSSDSISVTAITGSAFTIPYADGEKTYKIPVVGGNVYTLSWEADSDLSAPIYTFENGSSSKNHVVNNQNAKFMTFSVAPETTFITLRFAANNIGDTITYSNIQFENGSVSDYEPYYESQTKYIYLTMPLGKDEYIDFKQQKIYRSDNTSEIVNIPAFSSIGGTNILSVNTTVKPERVYVQGNIEEVQLASLQQFSFKQQDLQTSNFNASEISPDIVPIEEPVLNSNEVGGDESAE